MGQATRPDAWDQGVAAARRGETSAANPYPPGTYQHHRWEDGYWAKWRVQEWWARRRRSL